MIGLEDTTLSVTEEDGAFVEVCAVLSSGELERNAEIELVTSDNTAVGKLMSKILFHTITFKITLKATVVVDKELYNIVISLLLSRGCLYN